MSSGEHTRSALELCLLSLAGYGLLYGLASFSRGWPPSRAGKEIPVRNDGAVFDETDRPVGRHRRGAGAGKRSRRGSLVAA